MTKETGAVQGLFVHHDGRNRHTELACGFNLEPEWGQAYGEYFQHRNPYLKLDPSLLPEGSIGLLNALIPDAAVEKSEFYNDYVIPQGVTVRNAIRLTLKQSIDRSTTIALHRSLGNHTHDTTRALQLCRDLMPHLQVALDLHNRLCGLNRRVALLEGTLHRLPFGLLLVDSSLDIAFANERAEEILAHQDGLALRNGHLKATSPTQTAATDARIRGVMGLVLGKGGSHGGLLHISRPSGKLPYELLIAPVFEQDSPLADGGPAVALLLTDPERDRETPIGLLGRRFGLTNAEERVLLFLVQGWEVKDIGETLQVSRETVKSHLKAVFRKTGTRRQAELIAYVLRRHTILAEGLYKID